MSGSVLSDWAPRELELGRSWSPILAPDANRGLRSSGRRLVRGRGSGWGRGELWGWIASQPVQMIGGTALTALFASSRAQEAAGTARRAAGRSTRWIGWAVLRRPPTLPIFFANSFF